MQITSIYNANGSSSIHVRYYKPRQSDRHLIIEDEKTYLFNTKRKFILGSNSESEETKQITNLVDKFGLSSDKIIAQLDGVSLVRNDEGEISIKDVIHILSRKYDIIDKNVPELNGDKVATFAEVGYLLTYGVVGVSNFPKFGTLRPKDSRMKISLIKVVKPEDSSDNNIEPEYNLNEYYNSDLESYVDELRESKRPIPLPLYYGFKNIFPDKDEKYIFGKISRGSFFKIYEEFLNKEGRG